MVLLLSSDIETQPGPSCNDSFFSFCNWNINTLSKNDFQRVSLLEAHNYIFKYDISLCETSLNEATKVPENILAIISSHQTIQVEIKKGELVYFIRNLYP